MTEPGAMLQAVTLLHRARSGGPVDANPGARGTGVQTR